MRPVKKIADTKFFACPVSTISAESWQILQLVTDCTDSEGRITLLPWAGALLDQPPWFRQAVHIVRSERHSSWLAEKIKNRNTTKAKK